MFMGRRVAIVLLGFCAVSAAPSAHADSAPQFVIPSRPSVPIVINYYDARWAVVEGERGLDRPGHTEATVIGGRYVGPPRRVVRKYYPTTGKKPELGRHEIEPPSNPEAPTTSENFSRNWSTTS